MDGSDQLAVPMESSGDPPFAAFLPRALLDSVVELLDKQFRVEDRSHWRSGGRAPVELLLQRELDLEQPRPQLAGHEQPIAGSIVGNTVEDVA